MALSKKCLALLFCLLAVAGGTNTDSRLVSDAWDLIPADALIIGTINCIRLAELDLFPVIGMAFNKLEESTGLTPAALGTLSFFIQSFDQGETNDVSGALITGIDTSWLSPRFSKTHAGVTIHFIDNQSGFCRLNGYTVFGPVSALTTAIEASSGTNLRSSPRRRYFLEIMDKIDASILTLGILFNEEGRNALRETAAEGGPLAPFLESLHTAAFGIDYQNGCLMVSLAGKSEAQAAQAAVEEIRKQVAQARALDESNAKPSGPDEERQVATFYDSIRVTADGEILSFEFALPGRLIEALAARFAGILGDAGGTDEADSKNQ